MSETPRTQDELIDSEDEGAPIELDDQDILAVEPATPALRPTADQQRPLQTTGQPGLEELQDVFRSIRGKLSGVRSMGTAHDDSHELDFTGGESLVQSTEPDGKALTLDEVERRAKQKIFGDARAKREAAKTPRQRAATERAIERLRRLSGQPSSAQPPTEPIVPTSPRTPTGSPKSPKDKLIERLKGSG